MQNVINGPDAQMFSPDPSFYSGPAAARRGGRPNQNFIPGVDDAGSGAETQEFRPSRGDANLTPGYLSEGGGGAISPLGPRVRNATIAAPYSTAATAGAVAPVPLSPYPNTQRLLGANDAKTEADYARSGGNVGKVVQNGTTIARIGDETRELPRYEEAPGVAQSRQQVHADSMERKADILGGNYFTNRTNTVDANSRLNDQTGANVNFTNSGAHLRDADAAATTTLTPFYGQRLAAGTNAQNTATAQIAPDAAAARGKTNAETSQLNTVTAGIPAEQAAGINDVKSLRQELQQREHEFQQLQNQHLGVLKWMQENGVTMPAANAPAGNPPAPAAQPAAPAASQPAALSPNPARQPKPYDRDFYSSGAWQNYGNQPGAAQPGAGQGKPLPQGATANNDGTITLNGARYARADGGWRKVG